MLKLDAVSVSPSSGIGSVDLERVLASTHRIGHDFNVIVLSRCPTPLLSRTGFEVAAPDNLGRDRTGRKQHGYGQEQDCR
jgi:hypothetical protein